MDTRDYVGESEPAGGVFKDPGRARVVDPGIFPFSSSMQMLSNMLDSTSVILSLLEFCAAVAVLAFGYDTVRQHTYTQLVREAGIHGNSWKSLECRSTPSFLRRAAPMKAFLGASQRFPRISLVLLSQAL